MARTFPAPLYTTSVQLNGITKEKLNVTSTGTTDSVATKGPSTTVAAPTAYYISPEATAVVGTLNAVGTASGIGWGLIPSDPSTLVPLSTDGLSLSAGTFTVQIAAARDTALTSADQTVTFTAILFVANTNATSFSQELGRQASASVTVTTTKTAFPITITTVAGTFTAGQILWLEVFANTTATSTTGSIASYSTNSTTAIRISATTCTYSINFNKSLSDTAVINDSVSRLSRSYRSLTDAVTISDTITRLASFPRAVSEPLATISDSLRRLFVANKSLSDTVSIGDSVLRSYVGSRSLSDSVPISDTVVRKLTFNRPISDTLAGTTYNFAPIIFLED